MEADILPSGGVTSPGGFLAGAVHAGIKHADPHRLDLGILFSKVPCAVAAVFTANKVKAAPVVLDQKRIGGVKISAVVMNSGCANAVTGEQGMADAVEMTELAAKVAGVKPESVLAASTGVIGVTLPMDKVRAALPGVKLTVKGGHDLARAIMTTDRVPKEIAVKAGDFIIGGMLKGSGMIHPNMATLLVFLTTDAVVGADVLKDALRKAVGVSFNMISVDGDNSTNDTVLLMSNGMSKGKPIITNSRRKLFQAALNKVCIYLAKEAVRDGEGATKLIEAIVKGAASIDDARLAARTIVGSSLVKTAVYGADPNWGRVLAAAGRSGAALDVDKPELFIGGIQVVKNGEPMEFDHKAAVKYLKGKEVQFTLDLHLGKGEATAWGCDMTEEYVKINAEYTT